MYCFFNQCLLWNLFLNKVFPDGKMEKEKFFQEHLFNFRIISGQIDSHFFFFYKDEKIQKQDGVFIFEQMNC